MISFEEGIFFIQNLQKGDVLQTWVWEHGCMLWSGVSRLGQRGDRKIHVSVAWLSNYIRNNTVDAITYWCLWCLILHTSSNTLRPRHNGRHFADDIFKWIFLNENIWIPIKISLKFVPQGSINNIPSLVQIMAWRRPGYKPLSEPMMVRLPTHICVTRPQWANACI